MTASQLSRRLHRHKHQRTLLNLTTIESAHAHSPSLQPGNLQVICALPGSPKECNCNYIVFRIGWVVYCYQPSKQVTGATSISRLYLLRQPNVWHAVCHEAFLNYLRNLTSESQLIIRNERMC